MKVLIACEFSGIVRDAFTARGHDATSCDLLPTEKPGKHIQGDVLDILNDGWDMMIGHPPCPFLTISANAHYKNNPGRYFQRIDAAKFFLLLATAPIQKICIENPVGVMSGFYRKPDQIIQPWQYGHPESKKTCLWLIGLPELVPTDILPLPQLGFWNNQTKDGQNKLMIEGKWIGYNDKRTAHFRSKTYPGIANAMAQQWG